MVLLSLSDVAKDYGSNLIFDEVTVEVQDDARTGLVGENGAGKSSLFRIIAGLAAPDGGTVSRKRGLTIGYLPQEPELPEDATVYEAVATVRHDLVEVGQQLRRVEQEMAAPELAHDANALERTLGQYSRLQQRFEQLGGYDFETTLNTIFTGLGIQPDHLDRKVGTLSGGEKKIVGLARLLVQKPELLLLDEPDNHLDMERKVWLEQFIREYPGAILIISHDRYLLDRVVSRILEIEDGVMTEYAGNYSHYVEERELRLTRRHEIYKQQQDELKRMEETAKQLKLWAARNPKFAGRADSKLKMIERARDKAVERPILLRRRIEIDLEGRRGSTRALELTGVSKSYDDRKLFGSLDLLVRHGERVGIVGPNGSGKSTILKIILGEVIPDMGLVKVGPSVVIGYYAQEQETLPGEQTPLEWIRGCKAMTEQEGIVRLGRLLFTYRDMQTPIRRLSGGEKSRLQFVRLMLNQPNLLLLDEPTNNLDIPSAEILEAVLMEFEGSALVVSHDRYFLDKIVGRIVEIGADGTPREYLGNFTNYDTVRRGSGRDGSRRR